MQPIDFARALVMDRESEGSVVMSLSHARENARQVRDQITSEIWERLNILYLRATGLHAERAFEANARRPSCPRPSPTCTCSRAPPTPP